MTDLTQALAELRQMELTYGQLWTAREVMQTQNADNCKSIATVLNAALSGTMIPRADADLAELATLRAQVERLTGALRFYADFHENPNDGPWGINSQDFGKEARAALTEGAAP